MVKFEFGGRILRHQDVKHDVPSRKVPLKAEIRSNPLMGLKALFPYSKEIYGKAVSTYMESLDDKAAPRFINADKFAKEIYADPELRKSFLARQGEKLNDQNIRSAVIGRLGEPEQVLQEKPQIAKVAKALEALISGDINVFKGSSPFQAGDLSMESFKIEYGNSKNTHRNLYDFLTQSGVTENSSEEDVVAVFNRLITMPNFIDFISNNSTIQPSSDEADAETIIKNKQKLTEIYPCTLEKRFNHLRKRTNVVFDFSGINALSERYEQVTKKDGKTWGKSILVGADTFLVKFDGIADLPAAVRKRDFGFIKVNSGFCAGMRIDSTLDAPSLVFEYFKGELLEKFYPVWLDLKGKGVMVEEAQIAFRPWRPQDKNENGEFLFEGEYLANIRGIKTAVESTLIAGKMPVIIGGDHSIAFATQGTINDYYSEKTGKPIGLIWIDAHADINTEGTSPSKNMHGGPVAGLLGILASPELRAIFNNTIKFENLVYIAERDLDKGEEEIIAANGIRWFKMDEIRERGIGEVMKEAHKIASDGTAGVSISFDIDAFDAELVPGTGTPVSNGLTLEEGLGVCKAISLFDNLLAFELVEINPANDELVKTRKLGARVLLQALLGQNTWDLYKRKIK